MLKYKLNKRGELGISNFNKLKTPLIIAIIFLILFLGIYFSGQGLVGLFIAEPGLISYEQNISITAIGDKTEIWNLAQYPEAFDLRTTQLKTDQRFDQEKHQEN